MSSLDFSHYDPQTVRRFLFHLLEANRPEDTAHTHKVTAKPTRAAHEVYRAAHDRFTAEERVAHLEEELDTMRAEFTAFVDEVRASLEIPDASTDVSAKNSASKKKRAKLAIDTKEMKERVKALESLHKRLKSTKQHAPEKLAALERRIEEIKKKLK